MIDVSAETLVSLREAADLFPRRRRGQRPHVSCVYRWTTAGCRGVVLDSVQVGGTRCTSQEAFARFIVALTALSAAPRSGTTAPVPGSDVDRQLDEAGL